MAERPGPPIQPWDEANRKLIANVHPLDWTNPEPKPRYHLVVVGAGTAGLVSAAAAAGLGARVALVERELMGGDCLNVGCVPSKTLIEIGFPPDEVGSFKLYKGRGCGICNGTGYKGRVGLYEVMEISEGIRDLVMVGATAVEIKRKALEEGMLTLRMSGLEKIRGGTTSIEEVLRETVL